MATTVTLKPNAIDLSGSTSGTTTLQATAVAGTTTITLPAATDTLVGKATTDTLTNKTLTTPVISSLSSASATALTLQSAGTTAITVDTSQKVGIGTASPSQLLHVNSAGAAIALIQSTLAAGNTNVETRYTSTNRSWGVGQNIIQTSSIFEVADITASATRLAIDSSGNVGIGTSSPRAKVDVSGSVLAGTYQTSSTYATLSIKPSSVTTPSTFTNAVNIWNGTTVGEYSNITFGYNTAGIFNAPAYMGFVSTSSSSNGKGDLVFGTRDVVTDTAASERMRISSGGDLLLGTTSIIDAGKLSISYASATRRGISILADTTGATIQVGFTNTNGNVGSIQTSGSSTSYVTSSDYRLKENIAPMTGALAKVAQLKPVTYKWKVDGEEGQGFIAHELQEVVPECVTGTKDATREQEYEVTPAVKDEEGNITTPAVMGTRTVPAYQGIDTSFLVATLTAAIQELKAINDTQAETINALTARIVALEQK